MKFLLNLYNNPILKDVMRVLTAKRVSKNKTRLCGVLLAMVAFLVGGIHAEIALGNTNTVMVGAILIVFLTLAYTIIDLSNLPKDDKISN